MRNTKKIWLAGKQKLVRDQRDVLARLMREVKTSRGSSAAHCDTRSGTQECNPCCLVQSRCQESVGNNNDLPNTVGKPVKTSLQHIKLQIPSVCAALK